MRFALKKLKNLFCSTLPIRTAFAHRFKPYNVLIWRGCELTLSRQSRLYSNTEYNLFYFCHKGVAGFVVPTQQEKTKPSLNDLKLERNAKRQFFSCKFHILSHFSYDIIYKCVIILIEKSKEELCIVKLNADF